MAKILTTAIVADIRNKLNGSVFSKNRYGNYVRTKVTPVNPQTADQQNARNRLATQSQNWRALSNEQRQSWINAAPGFPITDIFGNLKVLSGNALFVQLNTNLALVGIAPLSVAPIPGQMPALVLSGVTAAAAAGTVSVTLGDAEIPEGYSMVIRATPPVPQSINFVKNRYRVVEVVEEETASPVAIGPAYLNRFGAMTAGQKVFVQAYLINNETGQAGIPVMAETTVLA